MQFATKYAGKESAGGISYDLWRNCPNIEMLSDPNVGYYTFEDFVGFGLSGAVSGNVGYYAGKSGAWKSYEDTSVNFTQTEAGGVLKYNGTTTDNLEAAIQSQDSSYSIPSTAQTLTIFESIITKETVAATAGVGFVCGLAKAASPANSFMADAGADIADGDFVGFVSFDATGNTIDFVYKKTGGSLVTVKAGIATPVAGTYNRSGFLVDRGYVTPYIDGVPTTDIITASALASSAFPSGVQMSPVFGVKQGTNVAKYVKNNGIYVFQGR